MVVQGLGFRGLRGLTGFEVLRWFGVSRCRFAAGRLSPISIGP